MPGRYALLTAIFFGTSPLLWYYSEVALSYIVEVALALPILWACHRARSERSVRRLFLASVLLALLGAFRQTAVLLLLPLWLFMAWSFSWQLRARAFALLGGASLLWLLPPLWLAGGPVAYLRDSLDLAALVGSQTSIFSRNRLGLLQNVALVAVGIGVGVHVGLILIAAAHFLGTHPTAAFSSEDRAFFLLWAAPALLTYLLGHTGQLGYVLFLLPIWFLWAGASLAALVGTRASRHVRGAERGTRPLRRVKLAEVVALGTLVNAVGFFFLPGTVSALIARICPALSLRGPIPRRPMPRLILRSQGP